MKTRVLGALAASTFVLWGHGALAFDACPDGSFNTTASPDGTSYSTLFSQWILAAGDLASCAFTVELESGAPSGNIVVYSSDYRGFYELAAGDDIEFKVDQNGTEDGFTDSGAATVDFTENGLLASSDGKIVVEGEADLTNATDGATFAQVDSADFTEIGRITTPTDQTAAVLHLGASAGLLTGGLQPIEGDNEVGIIGGYGSYMFGANGRLNIADGFSVLGGVSLINQTAGASQTGGVIGAVSARYVEPGVNAFRLMAEGGLVAGGLQTTYPNTAGPVPTALGTIFARGGVVQDLAPATQVAVYGTLAETGLGSAAFTQTFPGFSVNVPAQTGFFTTAKATVAVTNELAADVDLTAEVSAGMVFSHSGMTATIPGIGTVSGKQNSGFVDYGLRLGWEPAPSTKLELFAQGSFGQSTGAHNQLGASAKLRF
jgi:hypothetical protein